MRNLLDERLREITNYYEIRYNQNKSELSKDVDQIRIDLDRQYARGNVQVLNEAKAILLESVHFSFSVLQENLSELIKKNSTDPKNLQKLVNDRLKLAKIKHSHITRLLNLIDGYKFIPLFMPATKPVREKKQDYFTTIGYSEPYCTTVPKQSTPSFRAILHH